MKENEYQCAMCGGIFGKGWSDKAAWREYDDNFLKESRKTAKILCDDCYRKMIAIDPPPGMKPAKGLTMTWDQLPESWGRNCVIDIIETEIKEGETMKANVSGLENMDMIVIYAGKPKERRFRVFPTLADAVAELLDESKRFWEWEKVIETQAAMIRTFQQRPGIYELLEKYMRDVLTCEGTTFVCDGWDGEYEPNDYTKEEHAVLLELRDKIEKEYYHER